MTMQSQDIFKAFGANWTWASMSPIGVCRVHTKQPTVNELGGLSYARSSGATVRCEAFDRHVGAQVGAAQIWERTDFSNGPAYETDQFGMPLPVAVPVMPAPPPAPMAPPPPSTPPRLTTEEAENGGLWAFANQDEDFVHVNCDGVVWFDLFKDGPKPRRSYAVEVDGVTRPIERTRSQPQLAPPEAGKPYVGLHRPIGTPWPTDVQLHPGLRDDGLEPPEDEDVKIDEDTSHGWFDRVDELEKELAKAKLHARLLLNSYDQHGEAELRLSIYLAIFGEQPK